MILLYFFRHHPIEKKEELKIQSEPLT
jgi:hypothetical protein